MVLAQEEVQLVIMVNREVERINKEIDEKPYKCKQLIWWLKMKSAT